MLGGRDWKLLSKEPHVQVKMEKEREKARLEAEKEAATIDGLKSFLFLSSPRLAF